MILQESIGTSYEYECVMPEDEYDALIAEIAQLRAELAAIKPSWNDAPDWATIWYIECGWAGNKPGVEEPYYSNTERRPEDT